MLRIALTGSTYVGKTELALELDRHFKGSVPLFTDLPQTIQTKTPGTYEWTEALQTYMEEIHSLPAFITDRSFTCRLAFEILSPTKGPSQSGERGSPLTASQYLIDRANEQLRAAWGRYKLVFVPIEFEGDRGDQGALSVDKEMYDKKIREIINTSRVPHISVHGTTEERLLQVLRFIGQ